VTPAFPLAPQPSNPFALVVSSKLGLRQRKTIITTIDVIVIREKYFLKMNQHVINECLYVSKGMNFVV
jgi:hypothetical protein